MRCATLRVTGKSCQHDKETRILTIKQLIKKQQINQFKFNSKNIQTMVRKSLLMLGVAAAVFAGCSNEEVMDMPSNRAIQFNSFVNNHTRAVSEVTAQNLTGFYVFGAYGSAQNWTSVLTNEQVNGGTVDGISTWTPVNGAYWEPSQTYNFGAYANGNSTSFSDASFDAVTNALTFTNYNVATEQKDLIAATATHTTDTDVSDEGLVDMSFQHMLSQVKFTFTNKDSRDYTMKISDIKVNAVTTATGTYKYETNTPTITWNTTSGATTGDYVFTTIEDIAADGTHETDLFVMPQNNAELKVTFTATFWDGSHSETEPIKKGTFTGSLKYTPDTQNGKGTANEWTPGYRYNYTAEVNGDDIYDPENPGQMYPIEFSVSAVDNWEDANNTPVTPEADKPGA